MSHWSGTAKHKILTYIFMYTYIAAFYFVVGLGWHTAEEKEHCECSFCRFHFPGSSSDCSQFSGSGLQRELLSNCRTMRDVRYLRKSTCFCSQFSVLIKQPHVVSRTNWNKQTKQQRALHLCCSDAFYPPATTKGTCHKCDFGAIDFWVNFQWQPEALLHFDTSTEQIKISISLPVLNSMRWQGLLCPPWFWQETKAERSASRSAIRLALANRRRCISNYFDPGQQQGGSCFHCRLSNSEKKKRKW